MNNYKQFTISTIPFNPELLSGLLWELEISGIYETETFLTAYTNDANAVTAEDIKVLLEKMKAENLIETYVIEEGSVENKNWNEEWEKNINVIEITDNIVIKPSFKPYNNTGNKLIITIDPKMSFGTGEHQTTKLMIGLIEEYVKGNERVLDIGSGTGVLAIAAIKLGAKEAIAVDNDEWCKLNGEENVKVNSLEDKIKCVLGVAADIEEDNFDLIVANINKHILFDIAKTVYEKTKKTGKVLLSGLLNIDEIETVSYYTSQGFRLIEKRKMDEWSALVLEK